MKSVLTFLALIVSFLLDPWVLFLLLLLITAIILLKMIDKRYKK